MAKSLVIKIVGDSSGYTRELDKAEKGTDSFGKKLSGMAKGGAIAAGAAGIALLTKGLIDSVAAAKDAEEAQSRLESALKSANISYGKHGKAIDEAIQKTSRLAAIDDEDLSDAFAKLVRTTGDVTKATEGMNLAADIARARHISLEAATKIVEKGMMGNVNAFKKVGVEIDKGTTATEALERAQKKFAGSAEAYGKTAAGAQDNFRVAVENLEEAVGKKLLPVLEKLAVEATKVISWLTVHGPEIGAVFERVSDVAIAAIKPMLNYIENMALIVADVVQVVNAVINGEWGKAWAAFSDIPKRMIDIFTGTFLVLPKLIGDVALTIGEALVGKIVDGVKALPGLWWAAMQAQMSLLADLPSAVATAATAVGGKILTAIISGITGSVGSLGGLGGKLGDALDGIGGVGSTVWNAAKDVGGRILDGLVTAIKAYVGIGNAIAGRVTDAVASIGDNLLAAGRAVAEKIKAGIGATAGFGNTIAKLISDGANAVQAAITNVGARLGGWVKSGLSSVGNLISGAFGAAVNKAIDVLNAAIRAYNAIPVAPNIPTIPHVGTSGGSSASPPASDGNTRRLTGVDSPTASAPLAVAAPYVPTPDPGNSTQIFHGPMRDMAAGGIVMPRPGGTIARIGEAGQPEAVLPLNQLSRFIGGGPRGGGPVFNINAGVLVHQNDLGKFLQETLAKYKRSYGDLGLA